ncbi:hypothetical protein SPRG_20927 [Saprolegnia parasitica CBS 223.65]|uniref:CCHC-type domain-containing protein n=1 Tax=Saprolegnia parasitica (strain CBS 223.65) TaxID=695850 RepID=A0A067C035_SAPPC|nr:hypothetical protein SPRG_20927 [Saprolegnia parasitica CBS 223.65]KDO24134.1 hypothetical protein SPRG_20927 [Saprolegnia parasitica CBS 223.65]|eukprot:XP_012205159.1 hypothetical protein SPRG_20927 [Saprolegnia parasitica CBS 223.65]
MSSVVVLSQLVHPAFKSIARRDVVVWKRARLEYETSMRRECQRISQSYAATCVAVRDSFAPAGFLEFLMKTKWGLWDDFNLLDVPDDKLWEAINGIIDKGTNKAVLTYDKVFISLALDHNEEDIDERVSSFVFKASQLIEEHGLSEKLENGKLKAKIFKALVERIRPQELQTDVKQLLDEKMAVKAHAGLKHLGKIILKRALLYKSWSPKTKRLRDKESSDGEEEQQGERKTKKKREFKQRSSKPPVQKDSKDEDKERRCWHCGSKKHKLRNCPSANAKQKEVAVKKNWNGGRRGGGSEQGGNSDGQTKKTKLSRLKAFSGLGQLLAGSEIHMVLTLNSVLDVPCVPGSGCDLNIIPAKMVEQLKQKMPDLQVINLDQPQLGVAVGKTTLQLDKKVQLRLQLHTAASPVNVPGLQACYVADEGDEFLVSNDVLVMLGIDLKRLLEQVAGVLLKIREIKAVRLNQTLWERFTSIATDAPAVAQRFAEQATDARARDGLADELR